MTHDKTLLTRLELTFGRAVIRGITTGMLEHADDPRALATYRQMITNLYANLGGSHDQAEQLAADIQHLVLNPEAQSNGAKDLTAATAICGDGPMAGEEFTVPLDPAGHPTDVVDVAGHTYQLAMQPPPTGARPWRYTTVREGTLLVLEGGQTQPERPRA